MKRAKPRRNHQIPNDLFAGNDSQSAAKPGSEKNRAFPLLRPDFQKFGSPGGRSEIRRNCVSS